MVSLTTQLGRLPNELGSFGRMPHVGPLCATGKRWQNFNLHGLGELLLKIFLMGYASIHQDGAELNDPVEALIRPTLACESESL